MFLHLIHPLGFKITDRQLKRSGMDYWYPLDVVEHESWEAFEESNKRTHRLWILTIKAKQSYWDMAYKDGDRLLFGNEGGGCSEWLHDGVGDRNKITIPHFRERMRSLNFSTSFGIAAYEVIRQVSVSIK